MFDCDVPAWGEAPGPLLPGLLRGWLGDMSAPKCIADWLGRPVTCAELDGHIWDTSSSSLDASCLRQLADLVGPPLKLLLTLRPFPLIPGLGLLVAELPLRPRTMNVLEREGLLEADGHLELYSLAELADLRNFGSNSLLDLLCVLEAAIATLTASAAAKVAESRIIDAAQERASTEQDLRVLAAWALGEHKAGTAGAVLDLTQEIRPREVEVAWQRTIQLPLDDFAGDLAQSYSPSYVADQFLTELDDRENDVLRRRLLPLEAGDSLDELARRHDLTRERIRQIETRVKERLATLKDSPVGRLAVNLGHQLGAAVPADAEDTAALAAALIDFSEPEVSRLLLLYLAGPYRSDDGWVHRLPSRASLDETRQGLLDAADGNGLVTRADVSDILDKADIRVQWHGQWVSRLHCLRRIGDNYLRWDGTTLDRLERLLRLRGEPATAEELTAELGDNLNPRGIKYRLMDDPRFIRINKQSQFALPDWGFDEYTGITDEVAQEIERCGGYADADHLIRTISATYGVAETSVRTYLGAPMFIVSDSGRVRLRTSDDDEFPVDRNLVDAADCCWSPGGWCLRIQVDADLLRGSGRPIPTAFAGYIGVGPGSKIAISGPESAIPVNWSLSSVTGPSIGSLRSLALALDASAGDLLFLLYIVDAERFDAKVVRASDIEATDGLPRLALLHGLQPSSDNRKMLTEIVHALGLKLNEGNDPVSIVDLALMRRRQDPWRELLPETKKTKSFDEVLQRLAEALG
jgi:Sigma-70, region 4